MNRKLSDQVGRILLGLAIISFAVTFLYGMIYYRSIENDFFYFLTVLQNSIMAFTFNADISFADLGKYIAEHEEIGYKILGYSYGIACFTAPYCTLSFFYKIIQKLTKLRFAVAKHKKFRHIIIFGYNAEVKALLSPEELKLDDEQKCKIHLVTTEDICDKDASVLIRKGVIIHNVDILSIQNNPRQVSYFLKKTEIDKVHDVILFDESSSRNFSIYHFFHLIDLGEKNNSIKFYCRCEDDGIRRIIEDYHDSKLKSGQFVSDLEIVSIPEIRVRKLLDKCPLHKYYSEQEDRYPDPNDWNLHLLIIGFGKLGQQLLLQAMNMGVVGSNNDIVIDVIDSDIEAKKSIFENHFSDKYVTYDNEDILINSDMADGKLVLRFRKMDIRYKKFSKQLKKLGGENGFTYIAICVENPDISLHCLTEAKRYMDNKLVQFAIRMDLDQIMEDYINGNDDTYGNVITIESTYNAISLVDLIQEKLDLDAKLFNHIYNSIEITNQNKADEKKIAVEEWKKLTLFRRNASRAIAQHAKVNHVVMKHISDKQLEKWFGKEGMLIRKTGNKWEYNLSDKEFAGIQSDMDNYKVISEMSRMEHRRWCYYTASCGWSPTTSYGEKKNDARMENPCLCTWDNLAKNLPSYCKYDLMPLLYEKKIRERNFQNLYNNFQG